VLPELRRLLADPPGRPAAVTLPALAAGFRRLLADYLAARVAAGELRPTTPAPRPSCCCQPWPSARSPAPARHRIGVIAFSDYSRAGDLGRGIAWYAALGIGAALLTFIAPLSDSPSGPARRPRPPCGWR
jgi:hypothetical protein